MPRLLLLLTLSLLIPGLSGCLPVLETCTVAGDPTTVWDTPDLCAAPCFVDADLDGHGAVPAPGQYWDTGNPGWQEWGDITDPAEACRAAGYAVMAGDCDDDDPRRFVGNREVCDGVDNDCRNVDPDTGEPVEDHVYGEAPIPGEPDGLYSCSPVYDTYVQLFLLAGSHVAGQPLGPEGVVNLAPGEEVEAFLRIGALVPADVDVPVAAGLSPSWLLPARTGFMPLIQDVREPDSELSDVYRLFERSIDGLVVPQDAELGVSHLVTLAATLAPEPDYIGSLTFPWYCYPDGEWDEGTPACQPVWADEVGDFPLPDYDLAHMDTLDLAGCVESGQARLPTLSDGVDEGGEYCEVIPGGPPCVRFYEPMSMGCAYLEIVVREDGP